MAGRLKAQALQQKRSGIRNAMFRFAAAPATGVCPAHLSSLGDPNKFARVSLTPLHQLRH